MTGKLAATTFVTGPRDEVAATDVYKLTTTSPINSIQDSVSGVTDTLMKGLRGGRAMLGTLSKVMSTATSLQQALSGKMTLARLGNIANLSGIGMKQLGLDGGAAGTFAKGVTAGVGQAIPIITTVGGIPARVKAGNFSDITNVGNIMGKLSGNPEAFKVNDLQTSVNVMAMTVKTATRLGIPNSFGEVAQYANLAESADRMDRGALSRLTASVLPDVLKSSDTASLRSMATINSPGALKILNPNAINDFTSNYKPPLECSAKDYKDAYDDILLTLPKVDPTWNVTSRAGETIPNITAIQNGSPAFQSVIEAGARVSNDASEKLMLLGKTFSPTNVMESAKKFFPTISTVPENTAVNSTDARNLNRDQIVISVEATVKPWTRKDNPDTVTIDGVEHLFGAPKSNTRKGMEDLELETFVPDPAMVALADEDDGSGDRVTSGGTFIPKEATYAVKTITRRATPAERAKYDLEQEILKMTPQDKLYWTEERKRKELQLRQLRRETTIR